MNYRLMLNKHKCVLSGSILFLTACSHLPAPPLSPSSFPTSSAASGTDLQTEMATLLAHGKPNRSVNEPGHETAFQYLFDRLQAIAKNTPGASVQVHRFYPQVEFAEQQYRRDFETLVAAKFKPSSPEYKKWKAFTDSATQFTRSYEKIEGKTLVLEIKGTETTQHVLWIGAHYDTITHDHQTMAFTPSALAPGADDNASGVVSALKLAEYFSTHPPRKTLRFIFFDYEEIFFLGSYALATDIGLGRLPWVKKNETQSGLINLEMIGWSKAKKAEDFVIKIYTREKNTKNSKADQALANLFDAKKVEVLANGFNRSDNWSFWQKGLPAICISQDWERDFNELNYHTANDTPETLNFTFMAEVSEQVRKAVMQWLDSKP